jgi:hypothetical protein
VSVVDEHAYKVDLLVRPYLGMHFTATSGIERLGFARCRLAALRVCLRDPGNAEILWI